MIFSRIPGGVFTLGLSIRYFRLSIRYFRLSSSGFSRVSLGR